MFLVLALVYNQKDTLYLLFYSLTFDDCIFIYQIACFLVCPSLYEGNAIRWCFTKSAGGVYDSG